MSILIEGVAIPTDRQLLIGIDQGHVFFKHPSENEWHMSEYAPIEIPPHGRLIDADKLTERLDGIWDCNDMVFEDDNICERIHADCQSCRWRETVDCCRRMVKHEPTVVPAESGGI